MAESKTFAEDGKEIQWTDDLEAYFASTGERASCLSWLHKKSESLYSKRRTYIDLPVIVLSSVIGFCTVGSTTLFAGNEQLASIVLGTSSLFVSVLNTTGSYFGWAKRAEGHRLSSIYYGKLYRFISVELTLPREERLTANEFLKYVKEQYDRLAETSPMVPSNIINMFRKRFHKDKYADVAKPEETNGLHKIKIVNPLRQSRRTRAESAGPTPSLHISSNSSSEKDGFDSDDETNSIVMQNPMLRKIPSFSKNVTSRRNTPMTSKSTPTPNTNKSATPSALSPQANNGRTSPRVDSVVIPTI
jgi:hypothetical protein